MPVMYSGKKYYRTYEVIEMSGVPRATFFRWLKMGKIDTAEHADHRGWPLWTAKEIQDIKKFSGSVIKVNTKE